MKKSAVTRLIIWSAVTVILISLLIGGLTVGNISFRQSLQSFGIQVSTYSDAEKYTVGAGSVSSEISDIVINWTAGEVEIETHSGSNIELSEDYKGDEAHTMRYLEENGKLTVQAEKSYFAFGIVNHPSKKLTVLIPETSKELKKLSVNTASAEISISGITVSDRLSIDTVSGDITVNSTKADKAELNSVSAAAKLSGSFNSIDSDTVSGNLQISCEDKLNKLNANSVSGDISLNLTKDNGFKLCFDSASGDINSNLSMTKNDETYTYGDGKADFEADTVSGDITIKAE